MAGKRVKGWADGALAGAILGSSIVGAAGLILALIAVLSGDLLAAAAALAASGLTFGLLANAYLRE